MYGVLLWQLKLVSTIFVFAITIKLLKNDQECFLFYQQNFFLSLRLFYFTFHLFFFLGHYRF